MYWLNCFQPQQYNRKAFLSLLPFSTHNEIKYRCLNADGRIPAEVTKLNLHSWETGAVGHANFAQHLTLKVKACSISHFTAPGVVEGKLSVFHFMLKSSCDSANLNWTVHYWQAEDNKVPKQSGSVWSAHSYSQCIKYSKRGQCSYASTWSCSYPYNVTAWSALRGLPPPWLGLYIRRPSQEESKSHRHGPQPPGPQTVRTASIRKAVQEYPHHHQQTEGQLLSKSCQSYHPLHCRTID